MLSLLASDSYKQGHHLLYPHNLEYMYSNTTPRSSRVDGVNEVVVFGTQYFVEEYLINHWNETFFTQPIESILKDYHRIIDNHLGPNIVSDHNIRYLHSLGYLPVRLSALQEGTLCPIGVPLMTITNTDPKCVWLTNFLETISQTVTWLPITSATTAYNFKKLLDQYAAETSDAPEFTQWQGHDFSMRGMSSFESAQVSGAAHLLSFTGSDSIPAISFLEKYYGADITKELISGSVTASEHSVQCTYFDENVDNEDAYIQAMLDAVPVGIVSIVSDGYDYWKLISENLIKFKDAILSRDGKVVIRPDTGDPVKIVTGYIVQDIGIDADSFIDYNSTISGHIKLWSGDCEIYDAVKTTDGRYFDRENNELTELEVMGSVEILCQIFGASKNSKGYLELDPHIGLIYGDSITFNRCKEICERLKYKNFSSTNVVYGIGSYTYQYVTRDTFSLACKATWVQVDGVAKSIFKSPKTGCGGKKSARGLLRVNRVGDTLVLQQDCTPEEEKGGELITIFEDGRQFNKVTLSDIRKRLIK